MSAEFTSAYPPSYPTIDPMTVCQANGTWGTWEIRDGVPDIRKAQEDCMKSRDTGANIKLASADLEMPSVNLEAIAPKNPAPTNDNACATNILKGAQWIKSFCKTPDNNSVTNDYLIASCGSGSLKLNCFNESGSYAPDQIDPTSCPGGVYIDCGIKLSCNECKDRGAINSVLDKAYINGQCQHIVSKLVPEKCKSSQKYLSPETGDHVSTAVDTCRSKNGLLSLHCKEGGTAKQVMTYIGRNNGWNCANVNVSGGVLSYQGCETLNF